MQNNKDIVDNIALNKTAECVKCNLHQKMSLCQRNLFPPKTIQNTTDLTYPLHSSHCFYRGQEKEVSHL